MVNRENQLASLGHLFSVLEQPARGDYERFIRGDIQVATGDTMAVPLPRSPHLTRRPISPPELVPPLPNAIFVINLGRLLNRPINVV